MQNRTLALLIVIVGLLQPLAGALAPAFGIGTAIGAATADTNAPEQPMPAFFSIWGLIFASYVALGVAGLLRPDGWPRQAGMPMLLAGLGNIVWMLSAQLIVWQPLDFLLLAPVFLFSWWAARIVDGARGAERSAGFYIADAASGLLAGWVSVAIAISLPLTVRSFSGLGPTDFPWPMYWTTILSAGALAWLFASRISRSLWYFAAAGWGLLGIAFHNWYETGLHLIGHFTLGCLIILLLLRLTRGANAGRARS